MTRRGLSPNPLPAAAIAPTHSLPLFYAGPSPTVTLQQLMDPIEAAAATEEEEVAAAAAGSDAPTSPEPPTYEETAATASKLTDSMVPISLEPSSD
jgi:hypothetical protein